MIKLIILFQYFFLKLKIRSSVEHILLESYCMEGQELGLSIKCRIAKDSKGIPKDPMNSRSHLVLWNVDLLNRGSPIVQWVS